MTLCHVIIRFSKLLTKSKYCLICISSFAYIMYVYIILYCPVSLSL
nr:MAG TPA_asm: hypothetical protein [Caudoviricetes sp.]